MAYIRKGFIAFSQFKLDSLISGVSILIQQVAAFVGIWAILHTVGTIGGWSFYELALIYAFFLMARSLSELFFDGVWNIGNVYIRRGQFDLLLTRPASVFLQVAANRVEFSAMVVTISGALLCWICFYNLSLTVTPLTVLLVILFTILGTIINTAVYLIFNSLNFWLVQGNSIADFVQTIQEFAKYPIGVFARFISFTLSFVLPFAFTTYFPAAYLLGREGLWVLIAMPVITAAVCMAGALVWRAGLRSYNSTGS
jgi:ABC-type uncharacterized transport system permease subunit